MALVQSIERQLPSGFVIQSQIGSGATSWVYLARRESDGATLAVKVLHPGLGRGDAVDRFEREMAILRTLDHPHVVPMLAAGDADGALYFTMPYVDGRTVRHLLAQSGVLPLADALRIARDVADALGHVHGRGIIHRDVKPDNILVADGRAYLMDFGFAHAPHLMSADHSTREQRLTIGTPGYLSPEQIAGKALLDWRSDFYSLGCVLVEMLAGRPPAPPAAPGAPLGGSALARRLAGTTTGGELPFGTPGTVGAIVRRCLAATPNDRYPAALPLCSALDAALAELGAVVPG